jgi:hypothetical protein
MQVTATIVANNGEPKRVHGWTALVQPCAVYGRTRRWNYAALQ